MYVFNTNANFPQISLIYLQRVEPENMEPRREKASTQLKPLAAFLGFFFPFNSTSFQGCSTVNQFPAYLLTQSQNTSLNTYLRKVRKGSLKVEPVPSYLIVQDEENDDAH